MNGSRCAHLPAVCDDRARARVRLDATPETERQTQKTRCGTSAALKCPGVSGRVEGSQPAVQLQPRREGPEEKWTLCEEGITKL